MSTVPWPYYPKNDYPTRDGKPMAETDWHRILMVALIETLQRYYAHHPLVYVSGNLLVFYQPGNRRRHLSPDVFVVRGVSKAIRPNYLIWEEGKPPEVVIELTSSSTRREDLGRKFVLYRDTLRVKEYFLFDPRGDYLDPQIQGYRLRKGEYVPIRPARGRLPSRVLGLHLEPRGEDLRLWDPVAGALLATPKEELHQAERDREQAERDREQAEQAQLKAEEVAEALRRENEDLRRRLARAKD